MYSPPEIILCGLSTIHSNLLKNELMNISSAKISSIEMSAVTHKSASENSLFIFYWSRSDIALSEKIIQLRSEYFFWNPIICLKSVKSNSSDPKLWSAWDKVFPPNITNLIELFSMISPLPQERKNEIVALSINTLFNDLCFVTTNQLRDQAETRKLLLELRDVLSAEASFEENCDCRKLVTETNYLVENTYIDEASIEKYLTILADIENSKQYDLCSIRIRTNIHRVSNNLILCKWSTNAYHKRFERILNITENIPLNIADESLPGFSPILLKIRKHLSSDIENIRDSLLNKHQYISNHGLQKSIRELSVIVSVWRRSNYKTYLENVHKLIIIEDDPKWQTQILSISKELAIGLEIDTANNVVDAERLLDKAPAGTLALVDLGLPLNQSDLVKGNIHLDAGLQLIKRISTKNINIQFIVLTATQNYEQVVRECLYAGVEPADYIHKDPYTWEMQLRSRIELALKSPRDSEIPSIEVFCCTSRTVRVNGVEVVLDRKPFVVLSYLASRSRAWCEVDAIRSALTQPGAFDITPAMSKEHLRKMSDGASFDPFDLLTAKHLQDYIYDLKRSVIDAFRAINRPQDIPELVVYDSDMLAYRLQSRTKIYDSFGDIATRPAATKVLVVEDHPQWSEAISARLSSLSLEVRAARCIDEFNEIIDQWVPDIVTLDMQIPRSLDELERGIAHERNGITVLQTLKQRYPEIRVAVHTAIAWNDAVMLEVLREGVFIDDYLDKRWINALDRLVNSIWRLSSEIQRGSRIPAIDEPDQIVSVSLQQDKQNKVTIGGKQIVLSSPSGKVFKILASSPNMAVDRDAIVDALWEADDLPEAFEESLNTIVSRLRKEITDKTGGEVDGKKLIRSADGVYWLHGVICT